MRVGNFEISVVVDSKISEEIDVNGATYVVCEPGKEYHVNVAVFRDRKTGQFPWKHLRFGLFVDGNDVQYWKRLDLSSVESLPVDPRVPVCVKFWGFKQNISELKSFVFATPSYDINESVIDNSAVASSMGKIRLVVHEARMVGGNFDNQQDVRAVASNSTLRSGNTKILDQPSVVTLPGQRVSNEREAFTPVPRWENVSKTPFMIIDVNYHTRSMIDIFSRLSSGKGLTALDTTSRKRTAQDFDGEDSAVFKASRVQQNKSTSILAQRQDEDVMIVHKSRVAPLLDLSGDDDVSPQWSTQEL